MVFMGNVSIRTILISGIELSLAIKFLAHLENNVRLSLRGGIRPPKQPPPRGGDCFVGKITPLAETVALPLHMSQILIARYR